MAVIAISESIKEEIASRFIEEQHPGYSREYQGSYYVVDGSAVVYAQANRSWDPWHNDADVISVDALIFEIGGALADHASFSSYARTELEWHLDYAQDYAEWTAAYIAAGEPDGPADGLSYEIVTWAEDNGFADRIAEIEKDQFDLAVEAAMDYIPDSYDTADLQYEGTWDA